MGKTAIIYARVSTAGQAEEELPVESQLDTCRRRAVEMDAFVLREFVDAGISGRTDDRPAFKEAIAFCRLNHVDYFVCWNTARFSRNRIDAPWHKVQLKKHGTKMIYVSMNLDTSTKEGWMMEGMLELIDEYYSRQIADDTVRSMLQNARDGFWNGGTPPFGYKVIEAGRRRRLAVVEEETAIVRRIFADFLAGAGGKSIAMELNRIGCRRRGATWSKPTIALLLKNWVYAGYIVFNRRDRDAKLIRPQSEWIRVLSHQAIIDEETFMKVQDILSARAPSEGRGSPLSSHLFTGLLKCSDCGRTMMIETATGRSARYSYYNCSGNMKGHNCRSRRIPADAFDRWLADFIVERIMSRENLSAVARDVHEQAGKWVKERERKRAAMVADLRDVERRRRRLYNLLETREPDAINLKDIKPRLMEMNERARAIELALTQLELQTPPGVSVTDADLEEIQDFVKGIVLSGSPAKVRRFFATFIEKVTVLDSDAVISYHKDRLVAATSSDTVHSGKGWLPDPGLLRTGVMVAQLPPRFLRRAA